MNKQNKRNKVFLKIAKCLSELSNCKTRHTGAVLVRDNMIISTGYNGTPKQVLDCGDGGCERCINRGPKDAGVNLNNCICVHAEENAIIQAAYNGISTRESVLYSVYKPCWYCLKSLINAGVFHVYYEKEYDAVPYPKELVMSPSMPMMEQISC